MITSWFLKNADAFSIVDFFITVPGIVLSLYIFFRDPIRKWVFFGYRPTIMLIIFDPKKQTVLLVKDHGVWGFAQGGIYSGNLAENVSMVLKREIGLEISDVEMRYWNTLGTVKLNDTYRNKRSSLGAVSLYPEYIGKGYIAFFVSTDESKVSKKLKLGYEINSSKFMSIKNARVLIKKDKKINKNKRELTYAALNELETYLSEKVKSEGGSL